MAEKIRVLVWGENVHERMNAIVAGIYLDGMHYCIAQGLREDLALAVDTATLQDEEHGLTESRLGPTSCSGGATPRTARSGMPWSSASWAVSGKGWD